MPVDTPVHKMAKAIERSGVPEGIAIATAQKKTGMSYATGKPPKSKQSKYANNAGPHRHMMEMKGE